MQYFSFINNLHLFAAGFAALAIIVKLLVLYFRFHRTTPYGTQRVAGFLIVLLILVLETLATITIYLCWIAAILLFLLGLL